MKNKKEVYCSECDWLDRKDIKRRHAFYHMFKYSMESMMYNKCNCPNRPKKIVKTYFEKIETNEMYCININIRNDCKNFKQRQDK